MLVWVGLAVWTVGDGGVIGLPCSRLSRSSLTWDGVNTKWITSMIYILEAQAELPGDYSTR